jgi:putative methionine-R-sulfoxide reductase with GAF domain
MSEPMMTPAADNEPRRGTRLTAWKVLVCYGCAGLFTMLVLATLVGAVSALIPESWSEKITVWQLFMYAGLFFSILLFSKFIGDLWRGSGEDLKLGFTDLPNPFYDEEFIKAPLHLQKQISKLQKELQIAQEERKRATSIGRDLNAQALKQEQIIASLSKKLTVLTRHHDNGRRLVGSAAYLLYKEEDWRSEMMNNILAEAITCLEKDQSDKSVALFKTHGDELRIEHYIRLSARSARRARFKKGEGFAGMIMESSKEEYISDVSLYSEIFGDIKPSDDYKSIVGLPIRVDDDILGVLCVQSEVVDGFTSQDLRTLRFYAHACALIFVYDIMVTKMSTEGVERDDK